MNIEGQGDYKFTISYFTIFTAGKIQYLRHHIQGPVIKHPQENINGCCFGGFASHLAAMGEEV